MKPLLYMETTIPSYLVARPSLYATPANDDILGELHAGGEQHAAAMNFDLHAICEEARRTEKLLAASGWKVVSQAARESKNLPQPA
jgi:hypothetical protein